MSVIQEALKTTGLTMQADKLPKEHRTVKEFQRLIAAVRAAEAAAQDQQSKAERELNESLRENLNLRRENEQLKAQLVAYRVKEGMDGISALTTADKTKLLAAVSDGDSKKS